MTVRQFALAVAAVVVIASSAAAAPWPEASGRTDGMPAARGADTKSTINRQVYSRRVELKLKNPASVMSEPLPTSRVVARLDANAPLILIDQQGDWLRVATTTGLGWIQRRDVGLPGRPATVTAQRVVLREAATIYHEPNLEARSVESLPLQSAVTLVEDGGDWLRVRTGLNNEGWLQRSFIGPALTTGVAPPQ